MANRLALPPLYVILDAALLPSDPIELTIKMLDAGAWGLAAGYTAASIAAGYAAIHLATAMVRRVRVRA